MGSFRANFQGDRSSVLEIRRLKLFDGSFRSNERPCAENVSYRLRLTGTFLMTTNDSKLYRINTSLDCVTLIIGIFLSPSICSMSVDTLKILLNNGSSNFILWWAI